MNIYPEFKAMCNGCRMFNWDDRIRKILINLNNIEVKILFSVRKSDESDVWSEFSALLIPAPEKEKTPDPDKNAEVEISEDL
jgi:hypothetical protein